MRREIQNAICFFQFEAQNSNPQAQTAAAYEFHSGAALMPLVCRVHPPCLNPLQVALTDIEMNLVGKVQSRPLSRGQAWSCAAMNQLAFPGMGSLIAGKRVGVVQAVLMLAGFFMFVGFVIWFGWREIQSLFDFTANRAFGDATRRFWWVGIAGGALCVIAWFWALFTSVEIVRESSEAQESRVPPQPK